MHFMSFIWLCSFVYLMSYNCTELPVCLILLLYSISQEIRLAEPMLRYLCMLYFGIIVFKWPPPCILLLTQEYKLGVVVVL